jgi:small subunit ribosomal protein S17
MRTKKGTIVSKSGDKSVVVIVHRYEFHPKYKKRYRISKKFHAHDEGNTSQVGDEVYIAETIPVSKLKRWKIVSEQEISSAQK